MFATNFKASIFVLPWLLLPLVVFAVFVVVVDPWIQDYGYALRRESNAGWVEDAGGEFGFEVDEGLAYDGDEGFDEEIDVEAGGAATVYRWLYSSECFGVSTVIAIAVNLFLLIVIPCSLGGFAPGKKRFEFYLGFGLNFAVMIVLPVVYYLFYELDTTTFVILLCLHAVSYMAVFIPGARFVSSAYRRAFWFA